MTSGRPEFARLQAKAWQRCPKANVLDQARGRETAARADKSQMSQESQHASDVPPRPNPGLPVFPRKDWTWLEHDIFEERAAILEYECGHTRKAAEQLAGTLTNSALEHPPAKEMAKLDSQTSPKARDVSINAHRDDGTAIAEGIQYRIQCVARALHYAIELKDAGGWNALTIVISLRLEATQRLQLAKASLAGLADDEIVEVAQSLLNPPTTPLPHFFDLAAEAQDWATWAAPRELLAYALAAIERMPATEKQRLKGRLQ